MIHLDLNVLIDLSKKLYQTVNPFLGLSESGKRVGVGFGGDPTRFIDQLAERTIIEYLKEKGISCVFVGEEGGVQEIGRNPEEYLIVDAVDGTTNAVRGINFASASLAVAPKDRLSGVEAAAVINLFNGELYVAEKDEGARCNGKGIKPSRSLTLGEAILSVDVSSTPEKLDKIIPLMKAARRVRSLGAASLEICHVASGKLDAYVDLRGKIRTLDFAAAMLILRESGGFFSLLDADEEIPLTKLKRFSVIAAANESLYTQIVSLVSPIQKANEAKRNIQNYP